MVLRPIVLVDVATYRDIRLRALADAPFAFGSTLAREQAFTEQDWIERTSRLSDGETSCGFLAMDEAGNAVGIIGCIPSPPLKTGHLIVSMWVAPEARQRGIASGLLNAIAQWAVGRGAAELILECNETNVGAMQLYLQNGFEPTGETHPYPNDPALREVVMRKRLSASSAP